jgi:hypothetical protein
MSFTGGPGTGKTTVAMRMASILHALGYIRAPRVHVVTRDDLVGQFIGHTAPKTKEALARAAGGVLFIDEAYYLFRPENERDYGQEVIEILLTEMENERGDLVVVFAGYPDRMAKFFSANPGLSSRVRALPPATGPAASRTEPAAAQGGPGPADGGGRPREQPVRGRRGRGGRLISRRRTATDAPRCARQPSSDSAFAASIHFFIRSSAFLVSGPCRPCRQQAGTVSRRWPTSGARACGTLRC